MTRWSPICCLTLNTDEPTIFTLIYRYLELSIYILTLWRGITVKTKINTSLAAKGALAHRLQRRTACKIQNGQQGMKRYIPKF